MGVGTECFRIARHHAFGVGLAGAVVMAAGVASAATPVLKFMPLGDSITQGGKGVAFGYTPGTATVGYRYPLYYLLKGGGYNVDFVGTQQNIDGGPATNTPNPAFYPLYNTTFDRDNQGHWGKTAGFINSNTNVSIATSLNTLAARGDLPDIVLMHLGTNDLVDVTTSAQLDAVVGHMGGIITKLRTANPKVKVFVSTIDNDVTTAGYQAWRVEYNLRLGAMVNSVATAASPVYLFDLVGKGFDASTMTYDRIHMNKLGEDFTAAQFYNTLVSTGVLPEPASAAMLVAGVAVVSSRRRRPVAAAPAV